MVCHFFLRAFHDARVGRSVGVIYPPSTIVQSAGPYLRHGNNVNAIIHAKRRSRPDTTLDSKSRFWRFCYCLRSVLVLVLTAILVVLGWFTFLMAMKEIVDGRWKVGFRMAILPVLLTVFSQRKTSRSWSICRGRYRVYRPRYR
jgi:hypothetical protein